MKTRILLLSCLLSFIVVSGRPNRLVVKQTPPFAVHFDPEKTAGNILTGIALEKRKKADSYTEGGHWLLLWNFVNAMLIAMLFLFPGLSVWLKNRSFGISTGIRGRFSYVSFYFILSYLLSLPLNIYQHFIREKQYGFLNQTFIHWLSIDLLKFITGLIIIVPLFLLGYGVLIRPAKNRPVYGIAIPFAFVANTFFFNHAYPVHPVNFIFEYGILILSGSLLVSWALNELIRKYGERLKLVSSMDIATMPVLVFLITSYLFIMTPVINTIKRESELEATIYGLNTARKPELFISTVLKSADHDKADPGFWEEVLFFDQPCLKKKLLIAEKWKAENLLFLPFFSIKGFGC